MNRQAMLLIGLGLLLVLVGPAKAQMVLPSFAGVWHPRVGSGCRYLIEADGREPEHLEAAVVAQEDKAWWLEMVSDANHSETVMKLLISPSGIRRVILRVTGKPAVEVPPEAVVGGGLPLDVKKSGRLVGHEKMATPAGEFQCDRYTLAPSGIEAWTSAAAPPYDLVKLQAPHLKIVLQKTMTGIRTRITETPQPLEMP